MNIADRLRELSRNLYWAWHPEFVRVFRDIEPGLWRQVNHNPVEFLERLAEEVVEDRYRDPGMANRLTQAFHKLQGYLEASEVWGAWHAGPLRANPVAYFSAEFGLHESLPIYSGGLGILAGDHLKAASDLGIPMVGVGLAYAYGYFDQSLDAGGWQRWKGLRTSTASPYASLSGPSRTRYGWASGRCASDAIFCSCSIRTSKATLKRTGR